MAEVFYHVCIVYLGISLGYLFYRSILTKSVDDYGVKKIAASMVYFFGSSGPAIAIYGMLEKSHNHRPPNEQEVGAAASLFTYTICYLGGVGFGGGADMDGHESRKFEFMLLDMFPDLPNELTPNEVKALTLWAKKRRASKISHVLNKLKNKLEISTDMPNHEELLGVAIAKIRLFFVNISTRTAVNDSEVASGQTEA